MKKNLFSILLVVVMTMALVACGSQSTNVSAPETTETVNEIVENSETVSEPEQATEVDEPESSEVTSEPEQATEAPVDEVASTPDSEAVETTEAVQEPETSEPEFTFTEVTATKYAVQSVNVRSGPSTDFDKIGSLSTNQEITVNGVCDQTGWFRFDLNGTVAFVSNRYVSDEKVEVAPPASNNSGTGSEASGTGSAASSNYETGVWYDMGEYFFVMCNNADEASYFYGHHYEVSPTLEARYPDRDVYIISRNNNITLVAALHKTAEGFPNWDEINYIPELGMN